MLIGPKCVCADVRYCSTAQEQYNSSEYRCTIFGTNMLFNIGHKQDGFHNFLNLIIVTEDFARQNNTTELLVLGVLQGLFF